MGTTNGIMLSVCICVKYKEESTAQVQLKIFIGEVRLFAPDLVVIPFLTPYQCLCQQVIQLYWNIFFAGLFTNTGLIFL